MADAIQKGIEAMGSIDAMRKGIAARTCGCKKLRHEEGCPNKRVMGPRKKLVEQTLEDKVALFTDEVRLMPDDQFIAFFKIMATEAGERRRHVEEEMTRRLRLLDDILPQRSLPAPLEVTASAPALTSTPNTPPIQVPPRVEPPASVTTLPFTRYPSPTIVAADECGTVHPRDKNVRCRQKIDPDTVAETRGKLKHRGGHFDTDKRRKWDQATGADL